MELIRQREANDCAVAALAMALGRQYDDVRSETPAVLRDGGINEMYIRQFLWDAGFAIRQLYERQVQTGFKDRAVWPVTAFAPSHVVYVRPHHWVAMDAAGAVFDPMGPVERTLDGYDVYSIIGIYPQIG